MSVTLNRDADMVGEICCNMLTAGQKTHSLRVHISDLPCDLKIEMARPAQGLLGM